MLVNFKVYAKISFQLLSRNWEIITTFAFEQTMLLRLVVVVNLCFLHQGAAY